MNKGVVLCCMALSVAWAKPNGLYHQQYNYRTSSSSYRNNELQHQNQDEGFYSKDGDLEGRFRPKINSHNQHAEYVNPKLRNGVYDEAAQTSSFGHLNAQNHMMNTGPHLDNLRDGGDYGGGYGFAGSSFQSGSAYQNYGNSNLRQVTQSLEEQLARQLQEAIYSQYARSSSYSSSLNQHQIEADRRLLEEELRRNVTMGLQEALRTRYGNQGMRGGSSYTLLNGRLQPTANYNSQELTDLTRQIETNLLRQLEQGVRTQYHTSSSHMTSMNSAATSGGSGGYYPVNVQERPNYGPVISNPDSLTTIATRVQNDLNEHLNKILEDTQRRYFAADAAYSHQNQNWENILATLQQELRSNITHQFQLQMRNNYGSRTNYNIQDLENLKRQIENNLLLKLNRDFNTQKESFFRTARIPGGATSQQQYFDNRPVYPSNQYNNYAGAMNQADWSTMQKTLQEDLSRQLQAALMQHQFRQSQTYSGATMYNPQVNYQATLQQLTAELNRNLTRQLEHSLSQYQGAQSYSRGNYDNQMATLRSQLQDNLLRELQQGLQQSYSRYSSWSSAASSSSSNYRPVRGFDSGLYQSYGGAASLKAPGEDCMMGDDPSTYQQVDRDLTQQSEDLTQQLDDLTQQSQQSEDLTQQSEDLTQQAEDLTQQAEDLTQQSEDLTQQPEDLTQQSQDLTQQSQDLTQQSQDLTQQSEDLTQQEQVEDLTQHLEKEDLTQQIENTSHPGADESAVVPSRTYTTGQGHQTQIVSQGIQSSSNAPESGWSTRTAVRQQYYQPHQTVYRSHQQISYTSPARVTRKYYVTDSNGRRREVDESEFRQELESFKSTPITTRYLHRYYVTDAYGHDTEIRPGQETERYLQDNTHNAKPETASQLGQSVSHTSRRYYITDSTGYRREVNEAQFQSQMENFRNTPSTTRTTHHYYVTDNTGKNTEINPNLQENFKKLLQQWRDRESESGTGTIQVSRKYYITDSSGHRQEMSEAQFQKYIENARSSSGTTRTIYRYYMTDSTGKNIEINPNEKDQFEKILQHTSSQLGSSTGTSTVRVSRKFYITDITGQRTEISEAQFQKHIENARHSPNTSRTIHRYYITDSTGRNVEINPNEEGQFEKILQQTGSRTELGSSTVTVNRKYYITDINGQRSEVSKSQFQRYIENARSSPNVNGRIYRYYVTDGTQDFEVNPNQKGQWEEILQQTPSSTHSGTSTVEVSRRYYITDSTTEQRKEVSEAQFQKYIDNARSSPTTRTIYRYYVTDSTGKDIEINPNQEGQWQQQVTRVIRRYYVTDSHGRRQEIDADQFRRELQQPGTTRVLRRYYVTDSSGRRTEVRPGQAGIEPLVQQAIDQSEQQSQQNLKPGQTDETNLYQQFENVGSNKIESDNQVTEQKVELGQQTSHFGHQQIEVGQQQVELGQQTDDSDLTQQTEDVGYGKLQNPHQIDQQVELGQETNDSDLTQQTEVDGFGQLQTGNHLGQQQVEVGQQQVEVGQQQVEMGQQTDDSDLVQQTENADFGQLQTGNQGGQHQVDLGQQIDDSDLTQQTEVQNFGQLPTGSHSEQQTDDLNLKQQSEDSIHSTPNAHYSQQQNYKPIHLSPQTSQVGRYQPRGNGQFRANALELPTYDHVSSQQRPVQNYLGQATDFRQEPEELGQQTDNPRGQTDQSEDLTEQSQDLLQHENIGNGKPPSGSFGQQQVGPDQESEDLSLTQQPVNVGFGTLQTGSQSSQQQVNVPQSTLNQQHTTIGRPQRPHEGGYANFDTQHQQNVEDQHLQQQAELYRQKQYDLTQQVEDSHIAQHSQYSHGYGNQMRLDNVEQPIEPQVSTKPIFDQQPPKIGHQETQVTDLDDPYQTSNLLIEKLRQKAEVNRQRQQYESRSVYTNTNHKIGSEQQEVPVETTHILNGGNAANTGYYSHSQGSHYTQQSYQARQLHYGTSHQLPEESANSFQVEQIHPQQAEVVEPGVKIKGHVDVASEVEDITTTTEAAGFWSRLGSKVKSKAQSIKEKIG